MMDFTPAIIQVVPHEDYTVTVFFCDGKTVLYDVKPKLEHGVFRQLKNITVFMERCRILNDTLAWDITGTNDPANCIDIDPDALYSLDDITEDTAVG